MLNVSGGFYVLLRLARAKENVFSVVFVALNDSASYIYYALIKCLSY